MMRRNQALVKGSGALSMACQVPGATEIGQPAAVVKS
jgi:hypothetical protein